MNGPLGNSVQWAKLILRNDQVDWEKLHKPKTVGVQLTTKINK